MVKKRKPYASYTQEFKLEALRLMEQSDKPASVIALELGVRRYQLYKWREQMKAKGSVATAKKGRPKKNEESPEAKLRAENKRLKEENEILKKASAYFARLVK